MKEVNVRNARLQLHGPLSLISFDRWDSVGSSSILENMVDRPSEEATSQSFDAVDSFA